MRKTKKKTAGIALVGLLVVTIIAGTFAYWNQTSTIENPFDTGKSGSITKEDFIPGDGDDWQPGVEVNKDVFVQNTGDQDLIVRVRLDEKWVRKSTASATPGVEYKTIAAPYTTNQVDANDGLTAADASVVGKTLANPTKWISGGDGWYYYSDNLKGGITTEKWLDAVELLNDADMGKMEIHKYVSVTGGTDESLWVWVEYDAAGTGAEMPAYLDGSGVPCLKDAVGAQKVLHNKVETAYAKAGGVDLLGYSQSDYTLTVTTQTVQATKEAIDAMFGGGTTFTAPAGSSWVLK